jgi:hypothetical protein
VGRKQLPLRHAEGTQGVRLGMGIPGMLLGIGVLLGVGVSVGVCIGMFGVILSIGIPILSIGIDMPQHMPSGLGASEGLGASAACCCVAFAGPSVNAPEELVQVPAKKLATAMVAKAKAVATVRLRSRRLAPTLLKKLIVESFRSERRVARQVTAYHIANIVRLCLLLRYLDSRPAGSGRHVRHNVRLLVRAR